MMNLPALSDAPPRDVRELHDAGNRFARERIVYPSAEFSIASKNYNAAISLAYGLFVAFRYPKVRQM